MDDDRRGAPGEPEVRLVEAAVAAGVRDRRVLDAIASVRRSQFVPADLAGLSRRDEPIPIGFGQTTSQPSLIARMVESLEIGPDDVVLEVGTGFGYETAVLAQLARQVYTIERLPGLAARARANLLAAEVQNAVVAVGDGALGLAERAPFDAVLVAAAARAVPEQLQAQLREGGRLVVPLVTGVFEDVVLFARSGDGLVRRASLCPARFVPLVSDRYR
jgi:protein-L-isoaspartate(D-aspartate) O-methyltransferase